MLLQFVPSAGSLGRGCYKKQRGDVEQCRHPLVIRGDCSVGEQHCAGVVILMLNPIECSRLRKGGCHGGDVSFMLGMIWRNAPVLQHTRVYRHKSHCCV